MRRWSCLVLVGLLLGGGCAKKVVEGTATDPAPAAGEDRIIEHQVVTGETLALIADNYYGDPAQAVRVARDNDLPDPDLVQPGSVLRLHFGENEWEQARRRAAALEAYNRGVRLMGQERLAEAEQQFRLALDTAGDLVAARYNLALVLVERGRVEEALPLFEELVRQRPRAKDIRFAQGHALFLATRFDEAVVAFDATLAVDSAHRRAAFARARALEEAGRTAAAVTAWRAYLEMDADSSWAAQARRRLQALEDAE
ncbi:MAG: tetratricopeptide repeat protein [bacterium]|nr:tetratricopeptide repeat protein [bacterium]